VPAFILADFLREQAPHARLLQRCRDGRHLVEVREHAGLRWFTAGGKFVQSMMRLDQPAAIVLPNQLTMLSALAWRKCMTTVLNLGSGSGAFERFFRAWRPHTHVTSVEQSAKVTALARAHFALPPEHQVILDTAENYVAQATVRFDLVLCDIFAAERHPDCLFDAYFHHHLADRLQGGGVLALNVSPTADDELVGILAALRQAFEWVVLAPVPEHGNVIVLASATRPPAPGLFERRLAALAAELGLARDSLAIEFERLPSRSAVLGRSRAR
jgi:spermidine synthase